MIAPKEYTLIGLVLFIACGLLVLIVVVVFVKRQIMRFTLRSKSEQHIPICADVSKKMKFETKRRIRRTLHVYHDPHLLNDESTNYSFNSTNFDTIKCLYRMKALDACGVLEELLTKHLGFNRLQHPTINVFLMNNVGALPPSLNVTAVKSFCKLYQHARYEPKPFSRELHNRITGLVTEMCNIIQGNQRATSASAIRPVADINELTEEVLSGTIPSNNGPNFAGTIKGWASKLLGSKSKKDYQTVPSSDSIDRLDETSHL